MKQETIERYIRKLLKENRELASKVKKNQEEIEILFLNVVKLEDKLKRQDTG